MEKGNSEESFEEESKEKTHKIDSDELAMQKRKEKIFRLFKNKYNLLSYAVLFLLVILSIVIRTRNLSKLRDITTGGWTLGPDLDPFLFLRWAKYIVEHGTLYANDAMRYVPLGFNTNRELLLHPYMMAWFHKVAVLFGSVSVEQSAALYPVFMFALTVVAFFFMTRKIFFDSLGYKKADIIALVSTFFLIVSPSLLPRTVAGIPEKESPGFLFLFLSFYLFLSAWKAKKPKSQLVLALLAGISTAAMSLVWGGFVYIFATVGFTVFIAFLLGQVNTSKIYTYGVWLFSATAVSLIFTQRYTLTNLVSSPTTGLAYLVFVLIVVHLAIFNTNLKNYFQKGKLKRVMPVFISLIVTIILGMLVATIFFGSDFMFDKANDVVKTLVKPVTDRLGVTVAENRQPFFSEWEESFGPHVQGIALLFWLFFIGSIYLFNFLVKNFEKKDRWVLTGAYILFLLALVFSRYAENSIFNGENFASLAFYATGFIVLGAAFVAYSHKNYNAGKEDKLRGLEFGLLFLFVFFFLSIVSARGSVRTIMVLAPSAAIIASYFVVAVFYDAQKVKDDTGKIVAWTAAGIFIAAAIYAGYGFYQISNATADAHAPSAYTQQWQKAMAWVRENTTEDAVFGHWWDYGYWLQSIGERATVLDGGNSISYWDYLMGRYGLTGTNDSEAIDFLYSHKTTHFLIDSSDIGKYGAFSSIGSDVNYDRASWIVTFLRDAKQVQELKNSTKFVYTGGTMLDSDIIYEDENGTKIFLPSGKAGIGAVITERDKNGTLVKAPEGYYIYQNKEYILPLRYAYDNGKLIDFGEGVEAGIYVYPSLTQAATGGVGIDTVGAILYLSDRTVKSQLARLYLYKEDNQYFKLVHSEDDFIIEAIKSQNTNFNYDIVYYSGFRGPIRIWEISYPEGMSVKEEFLTREYPEELRKAR
jgi:asparagine N-glycosylation enzyme membrane subunit Stt3